VAILAGGRATRLRPITEKIPKSLIDVAGKPFICRQLEYLCRQGVTKVVMCIGHLGEQFFVLYGDSYLLCDFRAVQQAFVQSDKPALMTVLGNGNRWDKSNVLFQGGRILEFNKRTPRPDMAHIDYGLGILSARVLDPYPVDGAFDLADVYHDLSLANRLGGFEVAERFYEIGSPQGLRAAEAYFTARETA